MKSYFFFHLLVFVFPFTLQAQGELWGSNPQPFRYFFGHAAISQERGLHYYQNVAVFANQFQFGLSDNFALGIGVLPTLFFEADATPYWITPSLTFPTKKSYLHWGINATYLNALDFYSTDDNEGVGLAQGTVTLGQPNLQMTIGLGTAYQGDVFSSWCTFSLSGMARLGKKTYLLTENYILPFPEGRYGLLSLGGRSVFKRFTAIDYGVFAPVLPDVNWIPLPWVGVAVPFGVAVRERRAQKMF